MTSLPELLGRVLTLPKEELLPGKTAAERPNEMALLDTIASSEQVLVWREQGVAIRRRCFISNGVPGINFRITNGATHDLIATYSSDEGIRVCDNRDTLPIGTIEELRNHIAFLASH